NALPSPAFLPTYAGTAWSHGQLPPALQQQPLRAVLDEVERWAATAYPVALAKGDRLTPGERSEVLEGLSRYTGLDKRYLDHADLRLEIRHFCKELLRGERRTVGRLDSRFTGIDESGVADTPAFDPGLPAIP